MSNEQIVLRIQAGENVADNMLLLWQQNRGFVYQMARKYFSYAEEDDLMQEGYLALCDAVQHYMQEQGVMFISYAGYWIKQRIQRYIDNCCNSVRLPVHLQEDIRKYKKIVKEYMKEYCREPSDRELCRKLYVSREKLQEIKKSARMAQIRSLSEPIAGEDKEITLEDSIASSEDLEEDVCRRLDQKIMSDSLRNTVDSLPEELAAVIRMRFFERKTLKETGQQLGVSMERVRQIEANAVRKLRLPHKSKGYKDYFEQYIRSTPIYHVGLNTFNRTWTSETELRALSRYERSRERQLAIERNRKDLHEQKKGEIEWEII